MNLKKSLLGLTLAVGLCFAGTANAADLYVSGAASLTNAFEAVKAAFVKKNPGVNVLTNYAASRRTTSLILPPARTLPSTTSCSSCLPTASSRSRT